MISDRPSQLSSNHAYLTSQYLLSVLIMSPVSWGYCKFRSHIYNIDYEEFATNLDLVDHPVQFPLMPDVASLYTIYREHVSRFPYQNLALYLGRPQVDPGGSLLPAVRADVCPSGTSM